MTAYERLKKARRALWRLTRVVYVDVPANADVASEAADVPPRRDYYCITDTGAGPACIATITAVDTNVLCVIPHAGSGMCAGCEYIDGWADGQAQANALLRGIFMSSVEIVPISQRDHGVCHDAAPFMCPECRRLRCDSERPMDSPF
jgi:hypothetical protein